MKPSCRALRYGNLSTSQALFADIHPSETCEPLNKKRVTVLEEYIEATGTFGRLNEAMIVITELCVG